MTETTSFEQFINNAKDTVSKINNGEKHVLIKKVSKNIKNERLLFETIAKENYVDHFNHFLSNIKEHYIGKMLTFDYRKTQVITNDDFLLKQNGVPRASYLIATLKDFTQLKGIEHFLLLFVDNFSKLEDSQESLLELVKHYKTIDLNDSSKTFNENKLKHMRFMGLDCKIMGMFYKNSDSTFDFSTQVNLVLSPENYIIARPNKDIKNIISNNQTLLNAKKYFVKNENFNPYPIGKYNETEADVFTNPDDNPDVYLDLDVFRCKRTAFFGKTRLGKSNTVKHIISLFLQDNVKSTNTDISKKTGFVVFDENGEYANTNTQDNTSLYDKYSSQNYIKRFTLDKTKEDNLMLNFYLNPQDTMSLFNSLMTKEKSIYIESFLNTDFISMYKIVSEFNESNNAITIKDKNQFFKLQLFWALLNKCGFKHKYYKNNKVENVFFENMNVLIDKPFHLVSHILEDLRNVYQNELKDEIHIFEQLQIQNGDDLEQQFSKMCDLIDLFIDVWITHPEYLLNKNDKKKYIVYDSLLEMFNTTNKAGYKILRKFYDFHSEKSQNNVYGLIDDVCEGAITAIIDLSTVINSDAKKYYAERLVNKIFKRKIEIFINNETSKKPFVIFHFEEAHNLFPSQSDKGESNVYYKLAKEGAKYNIGIMYATQSPSNIFSELLTQTENFFIGHLSAPKEVSALTSLSFSFGHLSNDIMDIKKLGYQRVLTNNHRYPIPVQVFKFE